MQAAIVVAAPLTEAERKDLQRLKGRVSAWRKMYRDVGAAIREIFNRGLWREWRTWENFIEEELQLGTSTAYELRVAADICDQLEAAGFEQLPASQAHAFFSARRWATWQCSATTTPPLQRQLQIPIP